MLAAVKRAADDNYVFQQDSTTLYQVICNSSIAAMQNSLLCDSLAVVPNSPEQYLIVRKI